MLFSTKINFTQFTLISDKKHWSQQNKNETTTDRNQIKSETKIRTRTKREQNENGLERAFGYSGKSIRTKVENDIPCNRRSIEYNNRTTKIDKEMNRNKIRERNESIFL